jgi:hypothetical protein
VRQQPKVPTIVMNSASVKSTLSEPPVPLGTTTPFHLAVSAFLASFYREARE